MAKSSGKSYQPKKDGNAKGVKIKKGTSGSSKPLSMPPLKKGK